jgi:hypothetical protein
MSKSRHAHHLRSLTIWQPWACLIVAGYKPYEFRRWRAPKSVVGQTIVIHAGARKPSKAELMRLAADPELTCLHGDLDAARAMARLEIAAPGTLPLGVAIGTVTLGEPIHAPNLKDLPIPPDEVNEDIWAWPMLKPLPLLLPVPMRGAQGFWRYGEAL